MIRIFVFTSVVAAYVAGLTLTATAQTKPQSLRPLIIDMHLHATSLAEFGPTPPKVCAGGEDIVFPGWDPRGKPLKVDTAKSCASPVTAPATEEQLLRQTLRMLERYNIRAVTSGSLEAVSKWRAAAPDRIIPALDFERAHYAEGRPLYRDPAELRRLFKGGKFAIFAEVDPQYHGLSPADESLEPYFALAEELDIPIGIHMGEGPVGGPHREGYSGYRVAVGRPLLLEEVLVRHPRLRVSVMHYAAPLVDD
ncbi:MAG: amidohydrolase family protein, partial [Candidatus Acidiferrales bacterium]